MAQKREIVVWEGEWPWLKSQVRAVRETVTAVYGRARAVLPDKTVEDVKAAATKADQSLLQASKDATTYVRTTPQALPAAGVVGVTALVTAKSCIRWGVFAGLRNGLVTGLAGTAIFFPAEVRAAVSDWFPKAEE